MIHKLQSSESISTNHHHQFLPIYDEYDIVTWIWEPLGWFGRNLKIGFFNRPPFPPTMDSAQMDYRFWKSLKRRSHRYQICLLKSGFGVLAGVDFRESVSSFLLSQGSVCNKTWFPEQVFAILHNPGLRNKTQILNWLRYVWLKKPKIFQK